MSKLTYASEAAFLAELATIYKRVGTPISVVNNATEEYKSVMVWSPGMGSIDKKIDYVVNKANGEVWREGGISDEWRDQVYQYLNGITTYRKGAHFLYRDETRPDCTFAQVICNKITAQGAIQMQVHVLVTLDALGSLQHEEITNPILL